MTVVDLSFRSCSLDSADDIQAARDGLLEQPDVEGIRWQLSDSSRFCEFSGHVFKETGGWRVEDQSFKDVGCTDPNQVGDFIFSQRAEGKLSIVGFQGYAHGDDLPSHGLGDRRLEITKSNK